MQLPRLNADHSHINVALRLILMFSYIRDGLRLVRTASYIITVVLLTSQTVAQSDTGIA